MTGTRLFNWMLCFGSASAISIALASAAQATDVDAQPGPSQVRDTANLENQANEAVDDIVVTAARRSQSLQDVPMSVDVATGEQIQRLSILDAKDIQQLSPGLELTNFTGRNNTATLRGIGFDPDQGTSPAVDLYFNEVTIDAQTAFTAIYDIDQIEVLRGPQGALRGRTSPAGAITIRTKRPDLDRISGHVQGTLSEDHAYNFQGAVSLPLVTDELALRVAMLVDGNRLNHVYNINRGDFSRSRTESARASLAWRPSDDLDVNLMYQYLHSDDRLHQQVVGEGNGLQNPPIAADDYLAVQEGLNRFVNSSHLVTLNADWDLGPATLNLVAGHQESKLTQPVDLDSGNAAPGYIQRNQTIAPYNVDTAELRLSSNNDGFWNWTVGAFYNHHKGDVLYTSNLDTILNTDLPLTPGVNLFPLDGDIFIPVRYKTLSFSASSRFEFTESLTLEVAGRYSIFKALRVSDLTIPGFGTFPLISDEFRNQKEKYPTGGATLTYEFNSDLTAYAAYAHSFRAGSVGVGVPQGLSDDLVVTGSEKTDSFEVGLKTTFLDRRLSLNLAMFYQKFDGFLSRATGIAYDAGVNLDLDGNGVPDGFYSGVPDGEIDGQFDFNFNGDATVKGIEATLAGKPVDGWDFSVAASYVKARWDNARMPCNIINPATGLPVPSAAGGTENVNYCVTKGRLSDTPDFNLTANTEVRFPMANLEPFVRGLFVYRPSVFSEQSNFRYEDREMLSLFLGVRNPKANWEITAFAKNLLNQKRITSISSGIEQLSTLSGPFVSGYRQVNTTTPREFGITGSFRF